MENNKEQRTMYSYISEYRAEIMGVAIIWVLWFHSQLYIDFFTSDRINTFFRTIKTVGYGGVDIFLFLSGIGIYNSLNNNNLSVYYKNRIKRIIPAWWIVMLFATFYNMIQFQIPVTSVEIIGIMTLTGFWNQLDNQGNWYVYFIMFLYMIAPVLASLIKDSKKKLVTLFTLVAVFLLITTIFWNSHLLIAVERIPIFIIGLYVSCERDKLKANPLGWGITILTFMAGLFTMQYCLQFSDETLFEYGLWWYPFILIAPSLCALLAVGFDLTKSLLSPLFIALRAQGKASLEILIISEFLFSCPIAWLQSRLSLRAYMFWLIVISAVAGIVLHAFIERCIEVVERGLKE